MNKDKTRDWVKEECKRIREYIIENKIRKWKEECKRIREYITENKDKFRMYEGRSIASTLINNEDVYIVDSDTDKFELVRRIDKRFQDKLVLISTLDEILNSKEAELPSSEFVEER